MLLEITLLKELVEQQVRPFVYNLEAAATLGYVTGVQATFQYKLLVFEVFSLVLIRVIHWYG